MPDPDPVISEVIKKRGAFSRLSAHGFSCIDGAYFESPSEMVGGLLSLNISKAQRSGVKAVIDLRPAARAVRPLQKVMDELKAEHRAGFWYRGQRSRRDCLYRGIIPRLHTRHPIDVVIDAVVPSWFRRITQERPAAWRNFQIGPPLDYVAGPARAIFASRNRALGDLLLEAMQSMLFDAIRIGLSGRVNLSLGEALVAPGSNAAQPMLDVISIAQHYEYGSIMVDVSTDIDTGVWFATRDWTTGAVAGSGDGGPGAIYRIDATKVEDMMQGHISGPGSRANPTFQALGVFGVADISRRFDFLDRPRAQFGGSLLGMENFVTHFLLEMKGAIEVYQFDHASVRGSEISLGRDDICPPSDMGLEIFRPQEKFAAGPIATVELRNFLDWMDVKKERAQHLTEMRDAGII
jgi:hypothetical protein